VVNQTLSGVISLNKRREFSYYFIKWDLSLIFVTLVS